MQLLDFVRPVNLRIPILPRNMKLTKSLYIVLPLVLLGACSSDEPTPTIDPPFDPLTGDATIWPELNIKVKQDPSIEARIDEILATMSLEQKVAQLIQPEIRDFSVADMRKYGFGSYLNGGGAFPNNDKHAKVEDWVTLAENMYKASIDASEDGSAIPTMWGTDAVHGHNNVIGATIFPHNIGLGATNNPALIEDIASATAKEVMATGIDWVFAPTVAVVRNDRWGRTYEGYSEDPEIVSAYSAAIVRGLQGAADADFLSETRVISTVKHFLGDGGTQDGVDQGNNLDTEQDLFDLHAQGYVAGLSEGAQTVMASFNSWHGKKMHGNPYLLTTVLKERMGFDGFVVGDWLGHGQISGCTNYSCSQAINAGLDVFMASGDAWKPLYENTIAQVNSGEISLERIDDAVSRVLRVKLRAGLFEKSSPANRPLAGNKALVGHPDHRAIAKQAVRESLVLLKNNGQILPLDPSQNVLVAGDAADNIGKQSGGWTITWQGTKNENVDFPGGSSIYAGIQKAVSAAGGQATLSVNGDFTGDQPDVAIVVFGEEPYAEGQGDVDSLEYQAEVKTDLALLQKLKNAGIPTVSIFISGRPLWVNPELNASDAFVAAWLPGSEGDAISELLFANENGDPQVDFKGRLSFSWPNRPDQYVLNRGSAEGALFDYGYGLDYASPSELSNTLLESFDDLNNASDGQINVLARKVDSRLSEVIIDGGNLVELTANVYDGTGISYRTVDKEVQEDARRISFRGDGSYSFVASSDLDISPILDNGSLQFAVNLLQRPSEPVSVGIECGEGCRYTVDVTAAIRALPLNQWQKVSVPMVCFGIDSADATQISAPFSLSSNDVLALEIAEVALKGTSSSLTCN